MVYHYLTEPILTFPFRPSLILSFCTACLTVVKALQACHEKNPYLKYLGLCNDEKVALNKCLRAEVSLVTSTLLSSYCKSSVLIRSNCSDWGRLKRIWRLRKRRGKRFKNDGKRLIPIDELSRLSVVRDSLIQLFDVRADLNGIAAIVVAFTLDFFPLSFSPFAKNFPSSRRSRSTISLHHSSIHPIVPETTTQQIIYQLAMMVLPLFSRPSSGS